VSDQLAAGAARVDITAPLTIPYLGWIPRHAFFEGVHDRLYARAVVVGDGERRVAIVVADLIGVTRSLLGQGRDLVDEVRQRVERACGLPPTSVMVAATHAHSTPETAGIRQLLEHPGALEWLETLRDQLADAVVAADKAQRPVRVKRAAARVEGLGCSRRVLGKDGRIHHSPQGLSEDDVVDWGVHDNELTLVCLEPVDGSPPILLTHFACHPVTVQVQPLVSADFPGVATRLVEQGCAPGTQCVYLQGAAGSINPVRGASGDFADVQRYGELLAARALELARRAAQPDWPTGPARVGSATATLELPSRKLPPREEVEAEHRQASQAVERATTEQERTAALGSLHGPTERLERLRRGDGPFRAEVQALRIGDVALVGIPGEPFAELGLSLKHATAAPRALCVGYANGWLGYIAPPSAWPLGGYEVTLGTWSVVGPAAFGLLLDAGRRLVDRLWEQEA
jgi:hypothetical protein